MSNSKFLDQSGVQSLWSKILNEDYVNSGTLTTIINAIDETKQDKITGAASTITNNNLASNNILISNSSGKVAASNWASSYLDKLGKIDDIETTAYNAELLAKFALPGTLKWDGYIGDRPHIIVNEDGASIMALVHLYDDEVIYQGIMAGENFEGRLSGIVSEEGDIIPVNFVAVINDGEGFAFYVAIDSNSSERGAILYIPQDNYIAELEDGITMIFPKRGIYSFAYYYNLGIAKAPLTYVSVLTVEGYTFPTQDNDGSKYFETIEVGKEVVNVGDTLTWDGNTGGLETIAIEESPGAYLVKISDSVPTTDELKNVNWSLIISVDGTEVRGDTLRIAGEDSVNEDVSMIIYDGFIPFVFFLHQDAPLYDDTTFAKKGTYTLWSPDYIGHNYSFYLQVEGFNFLVEETTKETVLKTEHLPADLRYVGAAFDTVKEGNGTIEYDGEIEGRLTVKIEEDLNGIVYYVHVSDQVPDIDALMSQECKGTIFFEGIHNPVSSTFIKLTDGVYGVESGDQPAVVLAERDNINITYNSEVINIPKKGVYFLHCDVGGLAWMYVSSIIHSALVSERAELKEEALPSSMFEKVEKLQPLEIIFEEKDGTVVSGELIKTGAEGATLYKIHDSYIESEILLNNGYKVSLKTKTDDVYNFTFSPSDAKKLVGETSTAIDNGYGIGYFLEEPTPRLIVVIPKEGATFSYTTVAGSKESKELTEGVYFIDALSGLNYLNLTVLQSAPATQIKESAIPDNVKKHDWEKLENKPFHDGWTSVLFDSYKAIEGMPLGIPFENYDGVLVTELDLNELNLPIDLDFSKVVPGNTYTIAVGDKICTGEAFEVVYEGVKCVAIGNGALFGDDMAGYGDPNADFLWGYMPTINAVAMMVMSDAESGEYWLAMVEGDRIGDTITEDDNKGIEQPYSYWNHVSNSVFSEAELQNGFTITYKKNTGEEFTVTEKDTHIDKNYITSHISGTESFCIALNSGVYDSLLLVVLQDGKLSLSENDNNPIDIYKGVYFLPGESYLNTTSFKINNSTVFAPSEPIKQIEEKFIPDSIARVADIKKQVQANYLQGDSRENDFIKNRPFHDAWDSDIFKSLGLNTSAFPFEKMDGLDGVIMNPNVTSLVIYYGLFTPNKTYTFAVNGNLYSGTAIGIVGDPKGFVIGNSNLVIPGSNMGDLSANFVFAYSSLNTEMPAIFYIDDITEAGEYSFSAYDAGIRDTLNWNDGEHHPMEPIDSNSYFNDVFFTAEDLADGFTITIQDYYNSTIHTYTQDDAIVEEKDGQTLIWVNDKRRLAIYCVHSSNESGYIVTENLGTSLTYYVDVGDPKGKVISFKVNNPLVLMPKIPAKKIDKRFLPDDIGGGTNEEEVNAIIAAPKTQFTLIDQVTGENYIVCMRDGNLVTYKAE